MANSEKTTPNFVDRANTAIYDFVNVAENKRLVPGTGSFSTPFRGSLFGETNSDNIAEKLRSKSVDVLWMGSNPNVPNSLAAILGKPGFPSEIEDFKWQIACGKYSEHVRTKNGIAELGWDPIHRASQTGWTFYRRVLSDIADLNRVAMANFVVWGARDFDEFLKKIGEIDCTLLNRLVDFSIDLNREIIRSLRPRLLVVPLSLGQNKFLKQNFSSYLSLSDGGGTQRYQVSVGSGTFYFYICEHHIEQLRFQILHVPHPSSIRLSEEEKKRVIQAIGELLVA